MNNISDAIKFFKFLNKSEKAIFTCAWFDAENAILQGNSCLFYSSEEINELKYIYNKLPENCGDCTLHTTLNETNSLGRKTENMKGVRVLCLDLDREVGAGELENTFKKMAPGLIVESSPEHFHIYWKVSCLIPVERWSMYQIGLAWRFGGDLNMGQVTHMVRVPGFERKAKDGTLFVPKIVFEVELVPELTEKGVLALWPEIGIWAEKGREKLATERRRVGEVARASWKGGMVGKEGTLKGIIEAGRNSVMYFTVKDASYKELLSLEEAIEYGESLNKCFGTGLGTGEVRETCRKAWSKAQRALERKAERDKEAVEILSEVVEVTPEIVIEPPIRTGFHEPCPENTCQIGEELTGNHLFQEIAITGKWPLHLEGDKGNGGNGGNGHSKEVSVVEVDESDVNYSDRGIDVGIQLVAKVLGGEDKRESKIPKIPDNLIEVAVKFSDILWDGGSEWGREWLRQIAAAIRMKQSYTLAESLCAHFHRVGSFRLSGLEAYVSFVTTWGDTVHYGTSINENSFKGIIMQTLKLLEAHNTRESDQKPITDRQLYAIAQVAWTLANLWGTEKRQSPSVIVFQNGVFDLNSGRFSEDVSAPMHYSHPIWCRFDKEIAGKVDAVTASSGIGTPWSELVPKFSKYMADWFPTDSEIARVLLRYIGYSFTTDYGQQKFCFFYGPTRAGKGSIARLLCGLVGTKNYCAGDYVMLDNNFKTISIHNKLVICFEEAEGEPREHEKRMGYLKKLVGGERVMFEGKYREPFEDQVIGKFILQSNEPPNYQDKGHSVRARMVVVGFEKSFEAESAIDPAQDILNSEANKVATLAAIAWSRGKKEKTPFLVEGSRALDVGRAEVSDYIDLIGTFIRKYLISSPGARVKSSSILELTKEIARLRNAHLPVNIGLIIKQNIEKKFPNVYYSNNLTFENGIKGRGYVDVCIDITKLYNDMPELEEFSNY